MGDRNRLNRIKDVNERWNDPVLHLPSLKQCGVQYLDHKMPLKGFTVSVEENKWSLRRKIG